MSMELQNRIRALQEKSLQQDRDIASLQRHVDTLRDRLAKLEQRKKPGRPPKQPKDGMLSAGAFGDA